MKKSICTICLFLFVEVHAVAQYDEIHQSGVNIGIGTTSPATKLHVEGQSLWLTGGNGAGLGANAGKGLRLYHDATSNHGVISSYDYGAGNWNNVIINPNATEGNVGIGTNSPDQRLDVNGDMIVGRAGNSGTVFFRRPSDAAAAASVGFAGESEISNFRMASFGGSGFISFWTNGGGTTEKMRITPNGNVGIGTDNPAAKLDVRAGYIRSLNHNSTGGAIVQSLYDPDTDFARAIFSHNAYWDFTTNQWNIMGSGANDAQTILIPNKGGFNFIVHESEGNFPKSLSHADFVAGTKMILTRDGRLGVGTGNPGSFRLAVNGNIRAKEIKVETGWSDFVFEDDYDLPTLDEVEKYIKTHRHLPEIPSAKEVEENGVELGKMDSKLLQKIEELTLYIIDQEKRIKKLEAINTQLMKERK